MNILYEFKISFPAVGIIPIVLVVASLGVFFYEMRKNKKNKLNLILVICSFLIAGVVAFFSLNNWFTTSKICADLLKNNECEIVEGYVENFSTPTATGHDSESFSINGITFDYADFNNVGYSEMKAHGGVIHGNGQYLKISYVTIDGTNVILKIEGKTYD